MAVHLHKKDLLLPRSELLTRDCSVSTPPVNNNNNNNNIKLNWLALFTGYDSKSELNSPVESELGSTETESSEEEGERDDNYMAELTRQMTHYMFQDDEQSKVLDFAGSPQSTLTPSEQSPPLTPIIGKFDKMKINNGGSFFTTPIIEPASVNLGFSPNQIISDDQIRATQFYRQLYKKKQEQIMKQQQLYKKNQVNVLESKQQPRNFHKVRSFNNNNNGLSKSQKGQWPALQQTNNHGGSGMRAVFLNGSSSGGTGVFLPRGVGNSNESRKKSGCSTVLIPARVLQALELHFDKVDATSRSNSNRIPLHRGGGSNMYAQQEPQIPACNHQDIGLPQEWTY